MNSIRNKRILEAYIGEYASGKSEIAINRALYLLGKGKKVTLVDLDLVEPFYTLRPLKIELEKKGLEVIAWETSKTIGLGEAGSIIKPEMRWVIHKPNDVILDIGYGVEGAKTLNLVEGAINNPELKIYVVLNVSRPMTSDKESIIEYIQGLGNVHGIINNTHLGDETVVENVQEGAKIIYEVAKILNIPMIASAAEMKLEDGLGSKDCVGNPVWYINRYMNRSFW